MKKEHEKLEERRATCTNLTKLVDELEAKQKNVRVALSIINRNLSYIFSSNDRFKIDYRNNNYVLLSNVDMNRANEVMKLSNKTILPMFIIGDTFNRVVFVSQGYTIGLGEQLMKVIQMLPVRTYIHPSSSPQRNALMPCAMLP